MAQKKQYVVIERDEKLSIINVQIFAHEMTAWKAVDNTTAAYCTLHASEVNRNFETHPGHERIS